MLGKGYDHRATPFLLRKRRKIAQKVVVALMNPVEEADCRDHFS